MQSKQRWSQGWLAVTLGWLARLEGESPRVYHSVLLVSGLLLVNFLDYPYSRGSGGLRPTAMEQSQQEMVETTRQARASSPTANRPARTGISPAASAPAATNWKRKSGMRNAA